MSKEIKEEMDSAGGQPGRQNSYDLLRLISTIAVIFIHANWKYFGDRFNDPELTADWVFLSLINIITRFSVPCFAMLSGAFILQNKNNRSLPAFYQKSIKKIILPTIGAIVILFIAQVTVNHVIGGGEPVKKLLSKVYRGGFHNLWYVYMLVGLYFLTPYIIRLKENISWKQYRILAVVMMIWAVVSQAYSEYRLSYAIGIVFAFLGYFLMGDVIRYEIDNGWRPKKIVLCVICLVCIAASFVFRYRGHNYYTSVAYANFFSPSIVVFSICIFSIFGSIKMQRKCGAIVGLTFEIYLFHTLVLNGISPLFLEGEISPVSGVFLIVGATFVISLIVAFLYKELCDMIEKHTKITSIIEGLKIWKALA